MSTIFDSYDEVEKVIIEGIIRRAVDDSLLQSCCSLIKNRLKEFLEDQSLESESGTIVSIMMDFSFLEKYLFSEERHEFVDKKDLAHILYSTITFIKMRDFITKIS